MDKDLRLLLLASHDPSEQYELAGISVETVKNYVLDEMALAIIDLDWEAWYALLSMTRSIPNEEIRADTLNNLLMMPGHKLHQEVTREIQLLKSASSAPFIRKVLQGGFAFLEYTGSEDEVIAKWFSHALADIDTPDAIDVIEEFSHSTNVGIAKEMTYRLAQIGVRSKLDSGVPAPFNPDLSDGFEPWMLVEVARSQAPGFPWLVEALGACGCGEWKQRYYVSFISSLNPNQPGSEWQFETNVTLEHDQFGTVIVDILKGNRIGGLEFADRLV